MRLIDADKLKKDDEVTMWLSNDAIRTGKQLKMFSELFINKIDHMPTVQAVPIDVLDKIRAEIEEQMKMECFDTYDEMFAYRTGLENAIDTIDKYRSESEEV